MLEKPIPTVGQPHFVCELTLNHFIHPPTTEKEAGNASYQEARTPENSARRQCGFARPQQDFIIELGNTKHLLSQPPLLPEGSMWPVLANKTNMEASTFLIRGTSIASTAFPTSSFCMNAIWHLLCGSHSVFRGKRQENNTHCWAIKPRWASPHLPLELLKVGRIILSFKPL